jgi:hypothetical protein
MNLEALKKAEEVYHLKSLQKLEKTREENGWSKDNAPYLHPSEPVGIRQLREFMESWDLLSYGGSHWSFVNISRIIERAFPTAYAVETPSGNLLFVDRTTMLVTEDSPNGRITHWGEGKYNVLLLWGFRWEYWLNNREIWGHSKCPYALNDITIEEVEVITELWENGEFSHNYWDAYLQMKELLSSGEIPDMDEDDE